MTMNVLNLPVDNCNTPDHFDADVAIVGAAPVATLLAILLGLKDHRVTLMESTPERF